MLDLELEPFSHAGGIDGDGATRLLGRPPIEPLPLLIREAVQNSWDARANKVNQVGFRVDLLNLSPQQRSILRSEVFAQVPERHESLRRWLDLQAGQRILWLSDRGTVGLRGPTRANVIDEKGERNFADLVRNLGRDQSLVPGGGTYGYGKSSLFRTSQCKTVVFFTRIRTSTGHQYRLMIGSWIGRLVVSIRGRSVPHTGRMWWGRRSPDGIVDPILDEEARFLANALEAPSFGDNETGTSIGVLDPDLSDFSETEAIRWIISSLLWNCWPKLVDLGRGSEMTFKVVHDGRDVPIPSIEQLPPLSGYAKALKLAVDAGDSHLAPMKLAATVRHGNYRVDLGRLAIVTIQKSNRPAALAAPTTESGEDHQHPIMNGASHHVALMRKPKLVVKYLATDALPDDQQEYCGVFLSDPEQERHFADAEPPSHDDWRPELLMDPRGRSCVTVADRKIKEQVKDFFAPDQSNKTQQGPDIALGTFAGMLGGLLAGVPGGQALPGDGNSGTSGGAGGGGTPRKGKVKQFTPLLRREGGRTVAVVPFEAVPVAGASTLSVQAVVSVMSGDSAGVEDEPPVGAEVPEVIGWVAPDGNLRHSSDRFDAPRGRSSLKVALPSEAKVMIEIRVAR